MVGAVAKSEDTFKETQALERHPRVSVESFTRFIGHMLQLCF